jgi:hypothetical protein
MFIGQAEEHKVGDGWPARDRGKAGPGRGRAGCGQPGAFRAEPRWSARGEWVAGVAVAWGVGCGAQKSGEE